jgi:cytochrome c oxidase cbb3-type subunit 3
VAKASSLVRAVGAALALMALAGCDRAPGGAREWTPADHASVDQPPAAGPSQRPSSEETDQTLVEVAWQQSCASCHGPMGHGDGPEGPMVRAPDLTRADWQGRVTDAQLAETIRVGRGRMPAFGELPASIVDGLVRRIRAVRGR